MKSKALWILTWFVILTGGALLRVVDLNARPMHADEAVHAHKFGALLERGYYRYDPHEFHGPTLNDLTLFSAWLRGEREYWQIEEATLRLVPAVFGTLLILTPLFFIRGLGRRTVLFAGILIAFSPAFVYYSRYYIQEMLLVFFAACFLGSLWKYHLHKTLRWMIFAGCFLGLMHATKETFVFSVGAAGAAAAWVAWRRKVMPSVPLWHAAIGILSFAVVSALLFSSFGTNREGIIDSVTTYGIWMQRAGGQSVHIHPWYFYLDLLTWIEFVEPLTWNEDGIVALALIGAVVILANRRAGHSLARFLAVYTIVLTTVYCVIPYKTPWSMMSFFYGMTLVAAIGAHRLLRWADNGLPKAIFAATLLLFGVVSPLVQSKLLAFDHAADPDNPYVYAHTGNDVFQMVRRVKEAAYASGMGKDVPVQIIAEGDDYWPVPWYLRDFTNAGYWNHVDPSIVDATIILSQQRLEQPVLRTLYSVPKPGEKRLYLPLFDEDLSLRPGVPWQGYIRKDLWDRLNEQNLSSPQDLVQNSSPANTQPTLESMANMSKFSHPAMNSTFEIFIQHDNESYAQQAARAAFTEADRLEALLSRFSPNSDVSRINAAPAGQSVVVDQHTMECLLIARQADELTGGAFDVTLSGHGLQTLELVPESLEVRRLQPVQLDLGGIGKGFAVDRMADILKEWTITRALIHGGASSVLAMDPPKGQEGWPVTISNPSSGQVSFRLHLVNEVLASSGLAKGLHILDPATGKTVESSRSSWVCMPENAALADALSTSLIIVPIERVSSIQKQTANSSMLVFTGLEWLTFGDRYPENLQ